MALHTLITSSMSSHNLLRILVSLMFISTTLVHTASASNSTSTKSTFNTYKKFIKSECNSITTYPKVCYTFLSPYASQIKTNPITLTKVAVNVTLKIAKGAYSTLKKLSKSKGSLTSAEKSVISDCKENLDDTVYRLQQSADGLAQLNGTSTSDDRFLWDTIKTWMSAAITDESTCTDEFDEMKVRPSLQKKITTSVSNVAWMSSNALAFVNRLSY